jgi:hypothetical protein
VFDTRGLRQWWRETRGSEPPPELVSYHEYFKAHPEVRAQFAVSKWKWDSVKRRPAIFSIGCWMG